MSKLPGSTSYPEDLSQAVEGYLNGLTFDRYPETQGLNEAMRHTLLAGGRRIRPVLTLATARTLGFDNKTVLPTAAAIELIHTNSLVCDDLPAIDNHTLRRGKPSLHLVYGEGLAILAGYALYTEALRLLQRQEGSPEDVLAVINELIRATCVDGMVSGQYLDLTAKEPIDSRLLRLTSELKTGALIKAAVKCPIILSDTSSDVSSSLVSFASELGVLYQIVDDILDVDGTEKKLGKNLGSDGRLSRNTYVSCFGLDKAYQLAAKSYDLAITELDKTAQIATGATKDLVAITNYVYGRVS